jgi:hypothetical protein
VNETPPGAQIFEGFGVFITGHAATLRVAGHFPWRMNFLATLWTLPALRSVCCSTMHQKEEAGV